MADSQNTAAGTSNGAALTTDNGNWFLSSLSGLANVGAQIGQIYSSFQESDTVNEIAKAQLAVKPQQTIPAYQVTNAPDFFSDPARVKQVAAFSVVGLLLIGITIFIVKKA